MQSRYFYSRPAVVLDRAFTLSSLYGRENAKGGRERRRYARVQETRQIRRILMKGEREEINAERQLQMNQNERPYNSFIERVLRRGH